PLMRPPGLRGQHHQRQAQRQAPTRKGEAPTRKGEAPTRKGEGRPSKGQYREGVNKAGDKVIAKGRELKQKVRTGLKGSTKPAGETSHDSSSSELPNQRRGLEETADESADESGKPVPAPSKSGRTKKYIAEACAPQGTGTFKKKVKDKTQSAKHSAQYKGRCPKEKLQVLKDAACDAYDKTLHAGFKADYYAWRGGAMVKNAAKGAAEGAADLVRGKQGGKQEATWPRQVFFFVLFLLFLLLPLHLPLLPLPVLLPRPLLPCLFFLPLLPPEHPFLPTLIPDLDHTTQFAWLVCYCILFFWLLLCFACFVLPIVVAGLRC
ncbi:hypothetical protein MAPG_11067, partial [Magnaporthiopsis poae ATCC 64411]